MEGKEGPPARPSPIRPRLTHAHPLAPPTERTRTSPVPVTPPALAPPTFCCVDGGYFLPRPQLPAPRLRAAHDCLRRSAELKTLPFLALSQRRRPAQFTQLLIPLPNTRAWARVEEWVCVYICTQFSPPLRLHSSTAHLWASTHSHTISTSTGKRVV